MFHMATLKIITRKFYAIRPIKTVFQIKQSPSSGIFSNPMKGFINSSFLKERNFYTCIMVPVLPSMPSFAFSSEVINARLPGFEFAN